MEYEDAIRSRVCIRQAVAELKAHGVEDVQVLRDTLMAVGIPAIHMDGTESPDIAFFKIRDGKVSGKAVLRWLGY